MEDIHPVYAFEPPVPLHIFCSVLKAEKHNSNKTKGPQGENKQNRTVLQAQQKDS